jgi:hypothetical protein
VMVGAVDSRSDRIRAEVRPTGSASIILRCDARFVFHCKERHSKFVALREDKDPKQVRREQAGGASR